MLLEWNISVALTVFMGLASGGMLALMLMAPRRQQTNFTIIFALVVLLALLGAAGSVAFIDNIAIGVTNAVTLLVLSFTLGYALTTFSVLSQGRGERPPQVANPPARFDHTAVILMTAGEPPDYTTRSAARRFELADDALDVPPLLVRPFYMRELRTKYAAAGPSPYEKYMSEMAGRVQSRLTGTHQVYTAYYADKPGLAEVAVRAVEEGAGLIVVVHVRASDPPDALLATGLLEGVNLDRYGVKVVQVGPLCDSDLIPQIYVRRVAEAVPAGGDDPERLGLLLIGRGHRAGGEAAAKRHAQEHTLQDKVRAALLRAGFGEGQMAIGWLRYDPTADAALRKLVASGCKTIYWMPVTYAADGINTLYDVPAQIKTPAEQYGVKLVGMGAWNADSLAAEEIVARVRAATLAASTSPMPRSGIDTSAPLGARTH